MPRVAVITPTWQRHDLLLSRCIPSVAGIRGGRGVAAISGQTFRDFEHVVVSDGPDPLLAYTFATNRIAVDPPVRYLELSEHAGGLGAAARNFGIDNTDSELVAFLDDDNAYRPRHLEVLIAALDMVPEAAFAYGRLYYPETGQSIGMDPPQVGQIDGSSFVCRRSVFELGRWPITNVYALDWEMVAGWLAQGAGWIFVPEITLDYYWAR